MPATRPIAVLIPLALAGVIALQVPAAPAPVAQTWIVQAASPAAARASLARVDARPVQDLAIINAISAELTPAQVARLKRDPQVRLYADSKVHSQGLIPQLAVSTLLDQLNATAAKLNTLLKSTTNAANNTVASSVLGKVTSGASAQVLYPVLSADALRAITTPVVMATSSRTGLQDGKGVAGLSLTYETNYPKLIDADVLHSSGITGDNVTIAVLDSGLWQDTAQNYGGRIRATADVLNGARGTPVAGDAYGHGTHVTSVAASGAFSLAGGYQGMAPNADLVIVRAFDRNGAARYTDVIAGLNWVLENRQRYNIRVLNLSFGAAPQSFYWDDPLNQAVMAAWRAGIVVVAASGNDGPSPMTVNVPGNVPYVITVGALTDNYTPYDGSDDRLASFSGSGPTYEGFVKPEVVAPGGHIAASMSSSSYLANIDPDSMQLGQQMFTMSGTSQAAAVTSGVVALMLQKNPALTPDEVKCRLIATARPAIKSDNTLAYSVFQQGAGLINAYDATRSTTRGCANTGLDLDADIAGTTHFGGPANQDESGNYYVMDMGGSTWSNPLDADGYAWSRGYPWGEGYSWSAGYAWSKGYAWSRGYAWSKGYAWSRGYAWSKGYAWSRNQDWWTKPNPPTGVAPTSVVPWVPNE